MSRLSTFDSSIEAQLDSWLADSSAAIASGLLIPLDGGNSGAKNFHVKFHDKDYFLRLMPKKQATYHRQREIKACQVAAKAELGPEVVFAHAAKGILLTDFIAGRPASFDDYSEGKAYKALCLHLKKMASVELEEEEGMHCPEFADRIGALLTHSLKRLPAETAKPLQALFEKVQAQLDATADSALLGFCHFDMHIENFLITTEGKSYLIDWTDAGVGDRLADLAIASVMLHKTSEQALTFLRHIEPEADARQAERFLLYRHLAFLLRAPLNQSQLECLAEESKEGEAHLGPGYIELARGFFAGEYRLDTPDQVHSWLSICLEAFNQVDDVLEAPTRRP
jgi:aminoglycoside phosphotransferase (APT) family kinase protein